MSQNDPSKTPSTPATELASHVTQDIGGVQGEAPDENEADTAPATETGSAPDEPATDSGEIEWAGQLLKKPPTPEG